MSTTRKTVITTPGSYLIASSDENLSQFAFQGTISVAYANGTTGSWSLQSSPDGGNTQFPMKDQSGAAVQGTAAGQTNFFLGKGQKGLPLQIWLVVTAVTGTITAYAHGI